MIILPHPSKNFLEEVYAVINKNQHRNFKIILPTVACCIRLQQILVEKSPNQAAILPQIVPVINVGIEGDSIYEIPTAHIEPISRLEQRILLCEMIIAEDKSISIAESLDLSVYIMKLFDELADSVLDINDLKTKPISFQQEEIMHELADHWKERISFLENIYKKWQDLLAAKDRIDFAAYKQNMLLKEIESAEQKKYPLIIAGIFPKGPLLEKLADIVSGSNESYLILPPMAKAKDNFESYKTHHFHQAGIAIEKYKLDPNAGEIAGKIKQIESDNIRQESEQICNIVSDWIKQNEDAKIAVICRNKELINIVENKLSNLQIGHINLAGYSITHTKPYEFFISLIESLEKENELNLEKFIIALKSKFLYGIEARNFEVHLRKNHELLEAEIITDIHKMKPSLKSHIEIAEKLAPEIWQSIEGRILSDFLYELIQIETKLDMGLEEYVDFIKNISKGVKYHKNVSDQNVFFTNMEDADLCGYEYIICADMNEDSIPGKVSLDPWMSPKMRENVGLTDLSEKIGIDWYHFKNLLYRNNIVATRSLKKHGTITQSSRFLYAPL